MAVKVHDRLARSLPAIHSNVVAGGRVSLLNPRPHLVNHADQCRTFLLRQVKVVGLERFRNYQAVTSSDRKTVLNHEEELGFQNRALRVHVQKRLHCFRPIIQFS